MSTGTYVDINGLLQIENDYLNSSPILSGKVSTGTAPQIDNLKKQITDLQSSVSNVSEPILIHQNDLTNIVNNETKRLNLKKDSIENATTTQKRMIQMNDSDGKKNAEYIKMVIAGVIVLVIMIGLILLTRMFPFISGIVILIIVLLISVYIIYCVHKYNVISSRDKMDFDKLATTSPNILTSSQIDSTLKANQASGNLLGSLNLGGCIGSSCCDVGTVWDISGQMCIPLRIVSGFTTLNTAYKKGDMSSIIPYEKSEFDNYEKV
jgi:hypothetical protein